MTMLTQIELKKHLKYDPKTGQFTKLNTRFINSIAGSLHSSGYIHITIARQKYRAHRLAWLYIHGYFPEYEIDHINRNTSDNRLTNLREVDRQCNLRNARIRSDNTSGVKGVSWDRSNNKWEVRITISSKHRFLGRYELYAEAVCTRFAAEQCLDWLDCDNYSPAAKYVQRNIQGEF